MAGGRPSGTTAMWEKAPRHEVSLVRAMDSKCGSQRAGEAIGREEREEAKRLNDRFRFEVLGHKGGDLHKSKQ